MSTVHVHSFKNNFCLRIKKLEENNFEAQLRIHIRIVILLLVSIAPSVEAREISGLEKFQEYNNIKSGLDNPSIDLKRYSPAYHPSENLQSPIGAESFTKFVQGVDIFDSNLKTDSAAAVERLLSQQSASEKKDNENSADSTLITELINIVIDEFQNSPEALEQLELWGGHLPVIRDKIDPLLLKAKLENQSTNYTATANSSSQINFSGGSPSARGPNGLPSDNEGLLDRWKRRLTHPIAIALYLLLIVAYCVIHNYREKRAI